MTATTDRAVDLDAARPGLLSLIRSELLKIRTTHAWWWFALGALLWTVTALVFNMWFAHVGLNDPGQLGAEGGAFTSVEYHGANIYTSGQFLGLMFVMLIGILMVTNEFFHQTVTATFLTTPHRTVVIMAKLITAVMIGVGFWVVLTAMSLIAGSIFFQAQDVGTLLGEWEVQRAILLNLAAFAIWTIFGVAIGTLITSQLAATIIAAVLYLVGTQVAGLIFMLLANWLGDWVYDWQVIVPSIASQAMTIGMGDAPGETQWWLGAIVLLGYAIVAGALGVFITRKRDIS